MLIARWRQDFRHRRWLKLGVELVIVVGVLANLAHGVVLYRNCEAAGGNQCLWAWALHDSTQDAPKTTEGRDLYYVDRMFDQAQFLAKGGEYAQALKLINIYIQVRPTAGEGYALRAGIENSLGEMNASDADSQKATELGWTIENVMP